jgi:peptidoglycan/LPS O-acetylase OafA/YrhL
MTFTMRKRVPVTGTTAAKPTVKSLRRDIQGLRALAVIAVIFDHLLGWPSGGFVGVDVFFVISGFLITGLLLREHERTGKISFVHFYRNRVKRILPAAALVLVVTVVASFLLFNASRAASTLWDAVASFFFAANWRYAAVGTDYFQAGGADSPLQHYWSLAVEEQFYFVWPWLMLLIFVIARRSGRLDNRRIHLVVGAMMLLISAASFVWAMNETATNPTVAYFSTFSRAWELGVGAMVAVMASSFSQLPSWSRPVLGWIGLVGIVGSIFLVQADALFPTPSAVWPVLATALVIVAGTGGQQRYLAPLTNPVVGHLGNISFSLYLWHFPIIIFGTSLFGENVLSLLLMSVAMIMAAEFAYYLVEDPIRKSQWLTGPRKSGNKRGPRSAQPRFSKQYQLTALGLCVVMAGGLALAALQRRLLSRQRRCRPPRRKSSPRRPSWRISPKKSCPHYVPPSIPTHSTPAWTTPLDPSRHHPM